MSHKSLLGSESHFSNMGSWKAGRPTSNPSWLKTQSQQSFIASWLLLHGNMGPTFARCHNKWPWRPQTKKSQGNFTVTGMRCLDRARTANFGYRNFTAKDHSNTSLIHNSNIDPDDVWAGLWLPTQFSTLPTLWFPNGLNLFAKRNSGHGFLKQTCRTNLFATVRHIWQTCAAERLAVPKT